MILIVGATGVLGSALSQWLLENGEQIRAMTRTPEKAAELKAMGAEIVRGDLRDPTSLRRACAGIQKVVASAHSVLGRGTAASKYVDGQGHKDLIDAAKAAGAAHFVYVSAYGAGPDHPTPFMRFKYEVEQHLQNSGLNSTILRPTAFMETHVHTMIGQPILETGKVTLFGQGNSPRNFVAVDNILEYALLALRDGSTAGETIEIGGPENWTNMEVVALYEKLAGRPAKVTHVPRGVLRVMSGVLRPFHAGLSQIMTDTYWTDTTTPTFDFTQTREKYPVQLIKLEDWVRQRVQASAPATARLAGAGS